MLVIRCREGETVAIGGDIQLHVLAVEAGRVRLGFDAPLSVPVFRKCADLVREQNQGATADGIADEVLGRLAGYLSQQSKSDDHCKAPVIQTKVANRAKDCQSAAEK